MADAPGGSPCDAFVELSRLLVGIAYGSLDGLHAELDLPAFRALAFLDRHPGTSMGALASGVDLPPSTTTRLCNRLSNLGWLTRQHDPGNRRQVTAQLTPKGRKLVRAALTERGKELQEVLDRLEPSDRASFELLLPALVVAAISPVAAVQAWAV